MRTIIEQTPQLGTGFIPFEGTPFWVLIIGVAAMLLGMVAAMVITFSDKMEKAAVETGHEAPRHYIYALYTTCAIAIIGVLTAFFVAPTMALHESQAAYEEYTASVVLSIEEDNSVTELVPRVSTLNFPLCEEGSETIAAEYSWLNEDGAVINGTIMKTAEKDGACEYIMSSGS